MVALKLKTNSWTSSAYKRWLQNLKMDNNLLASKSMGLRIDPWGTSEHNGKELKKRCLYREFEICKEQLNRSLTKPLKPIQEEVIIIFNFSSLLIHETSLTKYMVGFIDQIYHRLYNWTLYIKFMMSYELIIKENRYTFNIGLHQSFW